MDALHEVVRKALEMDARLEALEQVVLGNLDPVARERYQMELEAQMARRGLLRGQRGAG